MHYFLPAAEKLFSISAAEVFLYSQVYVRIAMTESIPGLFNSYVYLFSSHSLSQACRQI